VIQAETLELLEWPSLCQQLATFAQTKLGAIALENLSIPNKPTETLQLLAQTQEIYNLELKLAHSLSFEGIEDIGIALERAELKGILSGLELLAIASTLAGMRRLRRTIDNANEVTLPVITALISEVRTYPELEQEIHRCIDDRGDVSDRASAKLAGVRQQIRQVKERLEGILRNIMQRQSAAIQQPLITQRGDRLVIPVKSNYKDQIPGIIHDTSATGSTLYVEPNGAINLNNQIRQLMRQEERESEIVRQMLTEQIEAVKPDLEKLLAIATTLDMATAKARYSLWLSANPPRFINLDGVNEFVENLGKLAKNDSEELSEPLENLPEVMVTETTETIYLKNLRHPLLVWKQEKDQARAVIPIDVNVPPPIQVVAITGPNTGGKTVTLKTMGLAALMAKVGLFIPAQEPVEMPWFEQVLADIGDEQSLEQSLSTFSGHIKRIVRILEAICPDIANPLPILKVKNAESEDAENSEYLENENLTNDPAPNISRSNSLILLDEIGAGTDPTEGTALAIALLEYLADHASLTIATTHFGELKALKYQDERFENASVEFDNRSLQPTYRLLWGIPGRSNALTIAGRLGLSLEIVDNAQNYVGFGTENINEVIAGLEAQRQRQERKAKEAQQLLQQTEKLHQEVARKANMLKERERELKQEQEVAIQQAIASAKTEIAKVIKELQEGPQLAQRAHKATVSLQNISEDFLPSRKILEVKKPSYLPKVGEKIRIPKIGQTAQVLSGPDDNDELTVKFGVMKMTLSLTEIESLDGQKPEVKKAISSVANTKKVASKNNESTEPAGEPVVIRTARNTIDVRGQRVADALMEIEQAISQAIDAGVLWIVHGKGTGKLKKATHELLAAHGLVTNFTTACREEGGDGVTIAYLK
jgi:DNA mismatch repair protein MutS2